MAFPCHGPCVFANEKIEVCAKMRLLDVIDIKFGVATGVMRGVRGPCGAAQGKLGIGHQ